MTENKLTEHEEMIHQLINSHFELFRRLNQINNQKDLPQHAQKALARAREINRYFADPDCPKIVQS